MSIGWNPGRDAVERIDFDVKNFAAGLDVLRVAAKRPGVTRSGDMALVWVAALHEEILRLDERLTKLAADVDAMPR